MRIATPLDLYALSGLGAATVAAPPSPPTEHPAARAQSSAVPALSTDALADIVAGLATADDLWRPLVRHDADDRTAVRLLATDAYEVWLLGWWPGQEVDLHDHAEARGALIVVDGELEEDVVSVPATPHRSTDPERCRRALPAGTARPVPAGTVHAVANRGRVPATSIHAYSPPLTTMHFWTAGDAAPSRAEPVVPEPPAISATAAARALHPSRRPS